MASDEIFLKYSWLNNDFFEKILSKDEKEKINIEKFSVQPALLNGENYSSYLIKAIVDYTIGYTNNTKQFIIKANLGEELTRSRNVFAKEIYIYQTIIPQFENALKTANNSNRLTPK